MISSFPVKALTTSRQASLSSENSKMGLPVSGSLLISIVHELFSFLPNPSHLLYANVVRRVRCTLMGQSSFTELTIALRTVGNTSKE